MSKIWTGRNERVNILKVRVTAAWRQEDKGPSQERPEMYSKREVLSGEGLDRYSFNKRIQRLLCDAL